jgi:hypothetical protein
MKLPPLKLRIYQTLHHLNRAFELVRLNLDRLDKLGLDRRSMREYGIMSEELRADANHKLTGILHEREEKEWAHFGRLARPREKRLSAPDAHLAAKRRRQEQRHKPQEKQHPTIARKQRRA